MDKDHSSPGFQGRVWYMNGIQIRKWWNPGKIRVAERENCEKKKKKPTLNIWTCDFAANIFIGKFEQLSKNIYNTDSPLGSCRH